jgi:hypothetical protein
MMRYLMLLAAICTFHAAPAQLLNRLKDRAASAVQAAGSGVPSIGSKARQAATGAAENRADAAGRATEKQGIIFSKEPFKPGQTTSTATDFVPTDNIYARVLMAKTLYDQLAAQGKEEEPEQVLAVGIGAGSGAPDEYVNLVVPKADYKKTFYDLDVLPAAGNAHTKYVGRGNPNDHISFIFTKFGSATSPSTIPFGKQLFTMEFDGENAPKGSFTMTVNGFPEKRALDARFNYDPEGAGRRRRQIGYAARRVQSSRPLQRPAAERRRPQAEAGGRHRALRRGAGQRRLHYPQKWPGRARIQDYPRHLDGRKRPRRWLLLHPLLPAARV